MRRRSRCGWRRSAGKAAASFATESFLICFCRRQLHRLQAATAPVFNLESTAAVAYDDIVDVFVSCLASVCRSLLQQHRALFRTVAVKCLAAFLLQECEDMCAASAPLTIETASIICSRVGLLRGRLMMGEREGGEYHKLLQYFAMLFVLIPCTCTGLDVSVCLRSAAVGSVLTVTHAKHAKDFVLSTPASHSSAAAMTPIKHFSKVLSSTPHVAAEQGAFSNDQDAVMCFLETPLPPPLSAARAKELLAYRKDLRCFFSRSSVRLVKRLLRRRAADIDHAFK